MPFKIIVALICTLVVLCGCDSKQSNVERGNAAKELFIGIGTEPAGLDPHLITGMTEIQVAMAFFQGLVTYNSETMEIVPGVAERWKLSDDGKFIPFISIKRRVGLTEIGLPRRTFSFPSNES